MNGLINGDLYSVHLIKKTQKISFDLSGGFESRILLPILLNSGIDINHIIINTNKHENSLDND